MIWFLLRTWRAHQEQKCFCQLPPEFEVLDGYDMSPQHALMGPLSRSPMFKSLVPERCGSKFKSIFAPALPELLWLPTVWRCPYIEIAFSTLDCSIVPTCGAWCSATAAKRGPLKQSWAEIQHSRDDEPLGVLMQMRNVRVNGFFFFSSLGVLPGVLVDTLSLCSGDFCVVEGDIDMQ